MTRSAKSQLLAAALFLLANASPGASTRGKKNLRRESSSAASSSNHDDGAHDEGFEVVGGPQESRHDVSVSLERSMLVERGGEGERLTSPESKEYIGSDSLAYVRVTGPRFDQGRITHLNKTLICYFALKRLILTTTTEGGISDEIATQTKNCGSLIFQQTDMVTRLPGVSKLRTRRAAGGRRSRLAHPETISTMIQPDTKDPSA